MRIPNKRGRIPLAVADGTWPDCRLMGRFLAKVGLEVLAYKTRDVPTWNEEIVDHEAFDELRDFARINRGKVWPFTFRTLHPVNAAFKEGGVSYELLNEFDVLLTPRSEIYSVVSIFGVEFVINLGG